MIYNRCCVYASPGFHLAMEGKTLVPDIFAGAAQIELFSINNVDSVSRRQLSFKRGQIRSPPVHPNDSRIESLLVVLFCLLDVHYCIKIHFV